MRNILLCFLFLALFPFGANAAKSKKCEKEVEAAAIEKMLGKPPRSEFRVLGVNRLGLANKKLGNLRLELYSVEISDETDGGVMIVFVRKGSCEVHDAVFGTHALAR
jgi:hypothetical protein